MDDQYFYDTEEFFDEYPKPKSNKNNSKRRKQRKRVVLVSGRDCLLKYEQKESIYVDLKLVSWNDSSAVEMRDTSENAYVDDYSSESSGSSNLALRATARWDSSEHRSLYLNKETPLDKLIYLVVKVNLKFKLYTANGIKQNRKE